MRKYENFISDVPFDKVTILDKNGNESNLEAYKIIIELEGKEYCIQHVPNPKCPTGLTISFLSHEMQDNHQYFAMYPGASNLIHISILLFPNLD